MHCVDLGESFQTHIYLQHLTTIQPRTSPVKFARSTHVHAQAKGDLEQSTMLREKEHAEYVAATGDLGTNLQADMFIGWKGQRGRILQKILEISNFQTGRDRENSMKKSRFVRCLPPLSLES